MNNNNFKLYSKFYNLLYLDKNYKKETEYIYNKIKKYSKNGSKILEIGTGTGIHAKLLQEKGLKITGIEPSEQMARQAKENGINCYIFDSSKFNLNTKFDAAISLFHVISYITDNEKLIKTFKNVYKHLNSKGIFIFDVWYSPSVYYLKPEIRIKRIENKDLKLVRIAEPVIHYNQNVVDVNYDLIIEEKENNKTTNIKETHKMRHFSLPEIQILSKFTGFELIESEEWITGDQPSEKTWGICFTLRKKK